MSKCISCFGLNPIMCDSCIQEICANAQEDVEEKMIAEFNEMIEAFEKDVKLRLLPIHNMKERLLGFEDYVEISEMFKELKSKLNNPRDKPIDSNNHALVLVHGTGRVNMDKTVDTHNPHSVITAQEQGSNTHLRCNEGINSSNPSVGTHRKQDKSDSPPVFPASEKGCGEYSFEGGHLCGENEWLCWECKKRIRKSKEPKKEYDIGLINSQINGTYSSTSSRADIIASMKNTTTILSKQKEKKK